jgi:hypothetical protein
MHIALRYGHAAVTQFHDRKGVGSGFAKPVPKVFKRVANRPYVGRYNHC